MIVSELIEQLKLLPQDMQVVTNCCEATSLHEDISDDINVGVLEYKAVNWLGSREVEDAKGAYIGSSGWLK